jgi:hypothetical protein
MISTVRHFSIIVIAALLGLSPAFARGTGGHAVHRSSAKCSSCARNGKGKIARSPQAKRDFQRTHPFPSTGATSGGCKGYVVDHIVPLKRGGADTPGNMEWQTKAEAKAKDKVE